MSKKAVEPLIAAARALEDSARRSLCGETSNFVISVESLDAMRSQKLPFSSRVSPLRLKGPRVDLSPSQQRGLATTAFWPQDGVEATRFPILCGVLQGDAALPTAKYYLHLPANNLVFIPAGVPHSDGSQPHLKGKVETDFCDLFWLYRWEGGLICHICHSHGNLHANFHANENCFLIGEQSIRFFDLLADAICNSPSNNVAIPYILPALLAVVGDDLLAGRFVQPGVLPASADGTVETSNVTHQERRQSAEWKEDFGAIMQAQNYIAFHLDQPITIDDMAQMACMSRAQFTQLFRRATGKSLVQYLTFARLERAKIFLSETDWNVDVVARAVGWRGAHLWKMFARELDITPASFRRASRENQTSRAKKANTL